MVDFLYGCKHCQQRPRLSSYKFDHRMSYSFVCCRIGRTGQTEEQAANFWNAGNTEAKKYYKKNNMIDTWEVNNVET